MEKPILIVICKLNTFIDSHVRELRKRGFRVTSLSNEEDEKAILDGEFTFLFNFVILSLLFEIVTDKVHVVPKWWV
jgi:hypothetical protein